MKKWMIVLPIIGFILLLLAFFIYTARVGYCYAAPSAGMSQQEITQLRLDCGMDSPRIIQFIGFLVLFIPAIILLTIYWLLRPSQANIEPIAPLTIFLILTLVESFFFMLLVLLSYPEPGTGSSMNILAMTIFGAATYLGILAIWKWKRWGLYVIQGVAGLCLVYSGVGNITMMPALVTIFNAFYLTMILRPLRSRMV